MSKKLEKPTPTYILKRKEGGQVEMTLADAQALRDSGDPKGQSYVDQIFDVENLNPRQKIKNYREIAHYHQKVYGKVSIDQTDM